MRIQLLECRTVEEIHFHGLLSH